jgi:hypothetical protein
VIEKNGRIKMSKKNFRLIALLLGGFSFVNLTWASPVQVELFPGEYIRDDSQCNSKHHKYLSITQNTSNPRWLDWKTSDGKGNSLSMRPWLTGPPKEETKWTSGGGCWASTLEKETTIHTSPDWIQITTDHWEDCTRFWETKPRFLGRTIYKITLIQTGLLVESIGTKQYAKSDTYGCRFNRLP